MKYESKSHEAPTTSNYTDLNIKINPSLEDEYSHTHIHTPFVKLEKLLVVS